MRRFIFLSLLIPASSLLTGWLFLKFYEPVQGKGKHAFISRNFKANAVDGALLKGTHLKTTLSTEYPTLTVWIADHSLDRNWDPPFFSFHSGSPLAKYLASHGIESIRYDHRGTGSTQTPRNTQYQLSLQVEDAISIYEYAHLQRRGSLVIIAHGTGCQIALYAAIKQKILPDKMILLSCGAKGDMNEIWKKKLFLNMSRRGVNSNILQQAEKEWDIWAKTRSIPYQKKATHSDLAAFRSALSFFSSELMLDFRKIGKKMILLKQIHSQVQEKKFSIHHLVCKFDEEMTSSDRKHLKKFTYSLSSKKRFYSFHEVSECNHFLRKQEGFSTGIFLTLRRGNPLYQIHPQALNWIRNSIVKFK